MIIPALAGILAAVLAAYLQSGLREALTVSSATALVALLVFFWFEGGRK